MKTEDIYIPEPLPAPVQDLLTRYHESSLPGDACIQCNSSCCSQGGFAILENIELIYALYLAGKLKRTDYTFPGGLSFGNFVFTYFDIRVYGIGLPPMEREMVFFHMRNLTGDNHLIAIPEGGSYWETRYQKFAEDPKLNHGCVFLSEKIALGGNGNTGRHCILHVPESPTHLTAKPIDCLLFGCAAEPGVYRKPGPELTQEWFDVLSRSFPDSVQRLKARLTKP
jgi:hypothetical protein